jgi:hypothetical protein
MVVLQLTFLVFGFVVVVVDDVVDVFVVVVVAVVVQITGLFIIHLELVYLVKTGIWQIQVC